MGSQKLFKPFISVLLQSLKKVGVKDYDVLYRGIGALPYATFKKGRVFRHEDVMSTSKTERVADEFSGPNGTKLIIEYAKGVELDERFSEHQDEYEVLLLPGSSFKVLRNDSNIVRVKMVTTAVPSAAEREFRNSLPSRPAPGHASPKPPAPFKRPKSQVQSEPGLGARNNSGGTILWVVAIPMIVVVLVLIGTCIYFCFCRSNRSDRAKSPRPR